MFKKKEKINLMTILVYNLQIILKKNKILSIIWIISNVIVAIIPTVLILLNKEVVNYLTDIREEGIFENLVKVAFIICILQVILSIIDIIKEYSYKKIEKIISFELCNKLYNKLVVMPVEKFEDSDYYNKVSLASGAIYSNGFENIKCIIEIASKFITIGSVIIVLSTIHWSLPLAVFISMIPSFITILVAKSISYKSNVNLVEQQRKENYLATLFFNKNILKEIKIFKLSNHLLNKWGRMYNHIRDLKIKIFLNERKVEFIGSLVIQIFTALVTIYLANNMMKENITIGDYVVLATAITTLQGGISAIIENIGIVFERALYNKAFFELLNMNEKITKNELEYENIEPNVEKITLKNIFYKYPNSNEYALKNINIIINAGEKIAIVGGNGSGKTTLINILMGNLISYKGEMKVNDVLINIKNVEMLQEKITTVLQEFNKYKFSIRDNIAFGNINEIDNDNLLNQIIKEVGLDSKIEELKEGIDTILSKEFEDGTELSGGQWQKISIARALIKESQLIIFDEPTAALDPIAELEVFNLLNKMSDDKTTIMISHRLGITRYADKIIFMNKGEIIMTGSHEYLIENCELYATMYEAQAKWYEEKIRE